MLCLPTVLVSDDFFCEKIKIPPGPMIKGKVKKYRKGKKTTKDKKERKLKKQERKENY